MAQRFKREILPATKDRPQIELVRSARRPRTISMQRDGVDEHGNPAYRLLIPAASTSEEIDEHIARLLPRIQRRAARRERVAQLNVTDEYLHERASLLVRAYLPELEGTEQFKRLSIRWVTNQRQRWGSATYASPRSCRGFRSTRWIRWCTTSCATCYSRTIRAPSAPWRPATRSWSVPAPSWTGTRWGARGPRARAVKAAKTAPARALSEN